MDSSAITGSKQSTLLARMRFEQGKELLEQRFSVEALREFNEACALDPRNPAHALYACWVQRSLAKSDEARALCKSELSVLARAVIARGGESRAFAHYVAGCLAFGDGDMLAARRHFGMAHELDRSHVDTVRYLRITCGRLGETGASKSLTPAPSAKVPSLRPRVSHAPQRPQW